MTVETFASLVRYIKKGSNKKLSLYIVVCDKCSRMIWSPRRFIETAADNNAASRLIVIRKPFFHHAISPLKYVRAHHSESD